MMMSKPQPSETAENPPAEKAKGPSDAVADLERRLQMLSGGDNDPPPPMSVAEAQQPPSFATPPVTTAPVAPAAAATGKSALLARIMAAQERAKQAKPKVESPPDFFSAPPPAAVVEETPPPAFDDAALLAPPGAPPQEEAPPAFSLLEEAFDMKPPATEPIAPPSYASAPPVPSAPTFEDLLGGTPTAPPPPLGGVEQLPPPPMPPVEQKQQSVEEEFAAALEGLSEEEKASLLAEQRQIMEQIEKNKGSKTSAAVSAADAFDQRSNAAVARIAGGENSRVRLPGGGSATSSADAADAAQRTVKLGDNQEVALHGQERTRAAIADGTAILVQCVNCNNWMQVTDNATLMFCPVCQVVSPVDRENAVATKEEALQMEADRKLAEELQKEEYTSAERQERRQRRTQQQQQQQAQGKKDESWWDWLGLGGGAAEGTERPQPHAQTSPQYRGDMGVARPPGAGAGLQAAQTGDMSFAGSNSYDAEDRSLLNNRRGPGGARVAEAKPLFACVADSITTAASSFSTALQTQNLTQDDEGNVHGVDGSSLLVVSQAGRNQNHG